MRCRRSASKPRRGRPTNAPEGEGDQKKGASKPVTRLPTERLATACWATIVDQRTGWEPASLLDFRPLLQSDRDSYKQLMHRPPGFDSAYIQIGFGRCGQLNRAPIGSILDSRTANRADRRTAVIPHSLFPMPGPRLRRPSQGMRSHDMERPAGVVNQPIRRARLVVDRDLNVQAGSPGSWSSRPGEPAR